MRLHLLLQNGRVLDPAQGWDQTGSVGVADGKIVPTDTASEADWVLDAGDCLITPGLVDFHTHIFPGGSTYGFDPALMIPHGTTAAVDAGTSGYANFGAFHQIVIAATPLPVRAFVSVSPTGLCDGSVHQNYDPAVFSEARVRELKATYGDKLLGLKVAVSAELVGKLGLRPLEEAVRIADAVGGLRVCVHTTNAPESASAVAALLRPGDIFCHCFHGQNSTILDADGSVSPAILKARKRGVLFDAANGIAHTSHRVARAALRQGFYPDIISTDAVSFGYNYSPRNKNLPFVLSKYLHFGMPLLDAVRAATLTPAAVAGFRENTGTLENGSPANITVFRQQPAAAVFEDADGERIAANMLLVPVLTVIGGRVVYGQSDLPLSPGGTTNR